MPTLRRAMHEKRRPGVDLGTYFYKSVRDRRPGDDLIVSHQRGFGTNSARSRLSVFDGGISALSVQSGSFPAKSRRLAGV